MHTSPESTARVAAQRHTAWLVEAARDRLSPRRRGGALARLTHREREVLLLVVARCSDREIAEALGISYRTATTHVAHVFNKLGVDSRRAAAALAVAGDDA